MIFRFNCVSNLVFKVFSSPFTPSLTYAISVGVRTVKKNWRSFGKVDKMRRRQNELFFFGAKVSSRLIDDIEQS